MTTSRPYLIRAIHEWILDNAMTPHLLVDIEGEGVDVPRQHGQNGKIVLKISPQAVEGLILGNDAIGFRARFGGVAPDVYVPVGAVLAIYSRENGRGMVLNEDDEEDPTPPPVEDGAGKLVNADMNEESANLLSLQTRQQLGTISLSLAQQSEQSVLGLF